MKKTPCRGDIVEFNMSSNDPHQQHIAIYLGNGKILQSGGGSVHAVNIGDIHGPGGSDYEFRRATGASNPVVNAAAVAHVSTVADHAGVKTTAGLSGGGGLSGRVGEAGQAILNAAGNASSWLGEQGQRALQAVLITEGGLNKARGDAGQSAGPLQFYAGGGQLNNLMRDKGMSSDQA
jgi:hypothetical protein